MPHQSRIACLRIPGFQIAAHQKAEPSLKGKPLVIVSGTGSRARVVACSARATAMRVWSGMRLAEARAVASELIWRDYDDELYDNTQRRLIKTLTTCTPKVTAVEYGIYLLDADGFNHLGGEKQLLKNLNRQCALEGFTNTHAGIAGSAFCALVASRYKRTRNYIVPEAKDAAFLAPLSIKHLPLSDLHEPLAGLGLKTMGQVAVIPPHEIEARFGKAGLEIYDLCCGRDPIIPQQPPEEKVFSVNAELGFPVDSMDQCRFVFKSLFEDLASSLKEHCLTTDGLLLEFFNEEVKIDERQLSLVRPSDNPKFLLELTRLSLESQPLPREFTRVSIHAVRTTPSQWSQDTIRVVHNQNEPLTACLAADSTPSTLDIHNEPFLLLLSRLLGRLGQGSVVKATRADSHMPDHAAAWSPVEEELSKPESTSIAAETFSHNEDLVLPIAFESMNASQSESLACGFVLKKSPAPEPVLVKYEGDLPRAITCGGQWYRIREMSEPEKFSGLWWENPIDKSYYVTLIEPAEESSLERVKTAGSKKSASAVQMSYLVLLVHDHKQGLWQLEGFFD